jgi:hypothetical protein
MPVTSPILGVEIDFSSGPNFAYPLLLDDVNYGLLDINVLGDAPADVVNITSQVMKVSTRRGRNRILSNFEAGSATVVLNDPDSDFSPSNTSSPYYGKLLPLRKIRIYADVDLGSPTGVVRYYIFSGYITSYDTGFYQGVDSTATVTLQCVDGFRLLNNVSTETPPVPGCPAGQLSGSRVEALLDWADWPNSMRSIDIGESTMQADPGGNRSVLQAIQTIEQSEFGAFFMDINGRAKFFDRDTISILADSTPRTYSDDGSGYGYTNLDFAYDDQLILNDVTVTRLGGIPQTVIDQDSIDKYFYKSGQRTDILVETDQESNDQARTIIATRKNAEQRIDSMSLVLSNSDSDRIRDTITLDVYNIMNITKTMPGGSIVTREVFCQGINHDVTPNSWTTKIFTAEPIIQAFILDSSTQGLLDINALSY